MSIITRHMLTLNPHTLAAIATQGYVAETPVSGDTIAYVKNGR